MPVKIENPTSLEVWKKFVTAVGPATTYHDHSATFKGPQPPNVPDKLQEILDHFGASIETATFAVRNGLVEGVWVDPFHNYIAIVFSNATGDDDDFVMINSLSGGRTK